MTTTAIENLRAFAISHNELDFAHLCTAALNGEQWAVDRVNNVLDQVVAAKDWLAERKHFTLNAIRSANTTRPDGAIARGPIEL